MPANLTPDYLAAEARFRAAETNEEKLTALDEMYATIPKHKGTEKMRADIKKRISKLRDKEKQDSKKGKWFDEFAVVKEGAGQIVLIGPPNSGKSSVLRKLTSAEIEVAEYPYTTQFPVPGMMEYEDVLIQLVDTPPLSREHAERGIAGLVRNADSAVLVLDLSDDALLEKIEEIQEILSNSRTLLVGEHSLDRDYPAGIVAKPTLIAANKIDSANATANLGLLREYYSNEFVIQEISAETGEGLEKLRSALFHSLGIIRVYTKMPSKSADMDKPFILRKGSTLIDFAAVVHKDFVHTLRFARAWGKDILDGAQIGKDHVLEDGYVVELHE